MKISTFLLLSISFFQLTIAQEQAIKLTNEASPKEFIIKENKRIRIETVDGLKISGRFGIEGSNIILINGQRIGLTDIQSIKRNPLLLSIFTSGFFIYAGAITTGMGVIIGAFIDSTAFLLTIPGAAMIYTGIKSPNFNRKFKKDKNWTFELITTSQ